MANADPLLVLIDIGGSGIRAVARRNGSFGEIRRFNADSYKGFVEIIRKMCGAGKPYGIALSVAGFVNAETGRILLSKCAPYLEGDIVSRLRTDFPYARVAVMNDGEAHARTLLLPEQDVRLGAIHLALGTSVSFGVINEKREIVRTCGGENWDIGNLRIRTREAPYTVWDKLGSSGLAELERNRAIPDPYLYFGNRLGSLLIDLSEIFRPRTIGLSGGIIRGHGARIEEGIRQEWQAQDFKGPVAGEPIDIVRTERPETLFRALAALF